MKRLSVILSAGLIVWAVAAISRPSPVKAQDWFKFGTPIEVWSRDTLSHAAGIVTQRAAIPIYTGSGAWRLSRVQFFVSGRTAASTVDSTAWVTFKAIYNGVPHNIPIPGIADSLSFEFPYMHSDTTVTRGLMVSTYADVDTFQISVYNRAIGFPVKNLLITAQRWRIKDN